MVPLSMTLVTSDLDFKVTTFFEVEYGKTAHLKDKVTIALEETTLHMEWCVW